MMEHPVPVFHSTSVPIDGSSKTVAERTFSWIYRKQENEQSLWEVAGD
jgi:hypothetical protein